MKQDPMKAYKPTLKWDPCTYQDINNLIEDYKKHAFTWGIQNAIRNLQATLKQEFEIQEDKLNEKD